MREVIRAGGQTFKLIDPVIGTNEIITSGQLAPEWEIILDLVRSVHAVRGNMPRFEIHGCFDPGIPESYFTKPIIKQIRNLGPNNPVRIFSWNHKRWVPLYQRRIKTAIESRHCDRDKIEDLRKTFRNVRKPKETPHDRYFLSDNLGIYFNRSLNCSESQSIDYTLLEEKKRNEQWLHAKHPVEYKLDAEAASFPKEKLVHPYELNWIYNTVEDGSRY